jgi:adenylylsulfate kinase-like enzyme
VNLQNKIKMIYWLTGQPGHGKTTLAKIFKVYLESRSSNKKVMHIDGDDLREIFNNKDFSKEGRIKNITFAQGLAKFLNMKDFDVVVSLVAPYKEVRESFKTDMGSEITEIYVHTEELRGREANHVSDYEKPTENFIDIDTTNIKPTDSLIQILNQL